MTEHIEAEILETTIRDGSYEIDFQYTVHDVIVLSHLLDQAGFKYIEVGHGWGLNGHLFPGSKPAAETDERYLVAVRDMVKNARLGTLLACNVFDAQMIETMLGRATDFGLDFIRLAVTPKSIPDRGEAMAAIGDAKKKGLTVSINFMRSYLRSPEVMADKARQAVEEGADWVYLVDSAGCWMPHEARDYVAAMADAVGNRAKVGFHAHNNLQLAVANSLAALRAGAKMVDTSLQGLGRATGNAQTEVICALLQEKFGLERQIDRRLVNALGRRFIRPLVGRGFEPTYVETGIARMHSGSLGQLAEAATARGVHPDLVVVPVGQMAEPVGGLEGKVLPEDVVQSVVEARAASRREYPSRPAAEALEKEDRSAEDFDEVLGRLGVARGRDGKRTAVLAVPPHLMPFDGPVVLRSERWAVGLVSGTTDGLDQAHTREHRLLADPSLSLSGAHPVSWADVLASAASRALEPDRKRVAVVADEARLRQALTLHLNDRDVALFGPDDPIPAGRFDAVITATEAPAPWFRKASDDNAILIPLGGLAPSELPPSAVRLPDLASEVESRLEFSLPSILQGNQVYDRWGQVGCWRSLPKREGSEDRIAFHTNRLERLLD